MSRADCERLQADLLSRPELVEELRGLLPDLGRSLAWLSERGYHVTREELRELADSDRELSDDELEQAAGGDGWPPA